MTNFSMNHGDQELVVSPVFFIIEVICVGEHIMCVLDFLAVFISKCSIAENLKSCKF